MFYVSDILQDTKYLQCVHSFANKAVCLESHLNMQPLNQTVSEQLTEKIPETSASLTRLDLANATCVTSETYS
jgi:hypothetical protein